MFAELQKVKDEFPNHVFSKDYDGDNKHNSSHYCVLMSFS